MAKRTGGRLSVEPWPHAADVLGVGDPFVSVAA